jgi:hypothetical protein
MWIGLTWWSLAKTTVEQITIRKPSSGILSRENLKSYKLLLVFQQEFCSMELLI